MSDTIARFSNRPKSETEEMYESKIHELNELLLAEQIIDIEKEIVATKKRLLRKKPASKLIKLRDTNWPA